VSIARWGDLEERVQKLETWAGPGQIQALVDGQLAIRDDLAKVYKTLERHDRILTRLQKNVGTLQSDVATLKTDVATLKTDMIEVKGDISVLKAGMAELLRRIPEPPSPN
jgi:septal ring factor EnvC (AmiA/AmiB activator)